MHQETRELLEEKISSEIRFVSDEIRKRTTGGRSIKDVIDEMVSDIQSISFDVIHRPEIKLLIQRFPAEARAITDYLIIKEPPEFHEALKRYMTETMGVR